MFPDDCRICGAQLTEISRVPVCRTCLDAREPFEAEYFCICCRMTFVNPAPLDEFGRCALCRSGARGFDAAYCFCSYEGTARKLIHLFKYGKTAALASHLGAQLSLAYPREQQFDAIVPMPMHWWRRWQRGFNQAGLLARELSRRTGVPVIRAAKKVKATKPQAGLSGARRRANVAGAYAATQKEWLKGKRVLLVDDVMTTGSSASACASVLKRAGASHVSVLTLARVDRRSTSLAGPVPFHGPDSDCGRFVDGDFGSNAPARSGAERELRAD